MKLNERRPSRRTAFVSMTLSLIALGALAPLAFGGDPATLPSGAFVDLDVNVFPPQASSPHHAVGGVTDFHIFQGNREDPSTQEGTSDVKITFPPGSAINGSSFPQCHLSLDPNAFSECPAKSLIGTGTAETAISDSQGHVSYVQVDAKGYNGDKYNGRPTFIFLAQAGGQTVAELDFRILHGSSHPVLDDFVIPGVPTTGGTPFTQFNFETKDLTAHDKHGGTVHLVTNPTNCPKSGWKFTVSEALDVEAQTLTATSFAPCVR